MSWYNRPSTGRTTRVFDEHMRQGAIYALIKKMYVPAFFRTKGGALISRSADHRDGTYSWEDILTVRYTTDTRLSTSIAYSCGKMPRVNEIKEGDRTAIEKLDLMEQRERIVQAHLALIREAANGLV